MTGSENSGRMSQDQFVQNISNLSLDASDPSATASKKHRRPNRAYHNFNDVAPNTHMQPSTMMNTPQQNNFNQFDTSVQGQQTQTFTPKQFNTSTFNNTTPGTNMQSQMDGQNQFANMGSTGYNQFDAAPLQESDGVTTTSHIVAKQRWEDQINYLTRTFETMKDSVPPLPTSNYYCVDQGSCNPKTMSLTMSNIPEDEHLRSATKLPLGLTMQPFADLTSLDNSDIPIVRNLQANGEITAPLRCKRCRTYVNPAFQFTYDSGVVCNVCKVKSRLSEEEFSPMISTGVRSDFDGRLDLQKGTVDFLVPAAYNAIQNVPAVSLHYIFVIDVSLLANENGSSLAVIEAVRKSIEYIADNQENCKIAIMTYDNKLKFYNLRPELESAQEYIVSEINDVFIPFFNGLFVKPAESMNVITDTLRKIEDFIRNDKYSHIAQSCYGSALQAAKAALTEFTGKQGGKIMCSLNSLPTVGNGNLSLKRDDNTKRNLQCDNEFYNKLSHELLRSYISVDLFVTSASFVDMVTVGAPVEMTSGTLKYYPHFRKENDEYLVVNDMIENISNIVGYQALLKVRCSTGLSVAQYFSKSVDYSDRDPIIPILTKDTNMDVLFSYNDKLKTGNDIYFQTALLYTDINGVRKVRSINCNGAVSNNIQEIFKFMNQNALMRIMIKDIIRTLGDCDFISVRKLIDQKVADILTQYKALVNGTSMSQLVLPDSLKSLPMYMLAFEKSQLMKPNSKSTRGNERIYDLFQFESFASAKLSYKLYPQIISLHAPLEEDDLTFYDANDRMLQVSPASVEGITVRNMHSNLINGGCYLMFQGETAYLWFNENTNKMLLQDLLGVDPNIRIDEITLFGGVLPETGSSINEKARNLLNYWCEVSGKKSLSIVLLRPNIDQYYSKLISEILTEDKTINMIDSYDSYLVRLHRVIQEKLGKEDYVKIAGNQKSHETFHQKFVQF